MKRLAFGLKAAIWDPKQSPSFAHSDACGTRLGRRYLAGAIGRAAGGVPHALLGHAISRERFGE